ncbi:Linear gramicidin dehydrogenase LgrE [Actinoalloteichus hoggarensis]|uniref:Linear gramicidin dehydrogenase LgrE n=1 Tax=Actinoalloteichus hoggarensis TaxID=1470176 RepID=A0A221VZF4_9PSEU|nr:Linear gramicidin dehydrogenase LgrE [Actinoalloteichus hoggarensis]
MTIPVVPAEVLWFRRFLPITAPRVRLFCFAHAGGAASAFRSWPKGLSPDVEMLAVRYPGRQDRLGEAGAERMGDLVEPIVAALEPFRTEPIALFGHSMGAAVAYEVAVRLEQLGTPAAVLFVSGYPAPLHHDVRAFAPQDDSTMLAEIRSIGGPQLADLDPALLELMLPALRADWKVLTTYRPTRGRPLSTPVVAYAAAEDTLAPIDRVVDWAEVTTAMFAHRTFRGGHFYLVDQEAELTSDITRHLSSTGRATRR